MQEYIKEIINKTKQEIISVSMTVLKEQLDKQKTFESSGRSSYSKTEQVLYNYIEFQKVIKDKEELIGEIQAEGIAKKSKDLTKFSKGINYNTSTDSERAEALIEQVKIQIEHLKYYIRCIDDALKNIRNDQYYDLIPMRYFEGKTREDIAEFFNVDVSTVSRNKSRLINVLKVHLFPDDFMTELLF